METTLFNQSGVAVAYATSDYHETIYLWDGTPVAYVYTGAQVYGINGRHLGWFIDQVLYNGLGERIGFTFNTCPVATAKEGVKAKKQVIAELRPRWSAPPLPNLSLLPAGQDLEDFLKEGRVAPLNELSSSEESQNLPT